MGGGVGVGELLCAALARRCSKIVDGLLTHTDRALHKSLRCAGGAVGDATGRRSSLPAVPLPPVCSLASAAGFHPLLVFHPILPHSRRFSRAATHSQFQESCSRRAPCSFVESFMSFFTLKSDLGRPSGPAEGES